MSGLEDRCTQFHEAALAGIATTTTTTNKSKGPAKEMATLRRFLHKNQNQRFTDKATSRLFDTIQIYVTAATTNKNNKNDKATGVGVVSMEDCEGLLEDALKMPLSVFNAKQKKTMLKWIEDIRGSHSRNNNHNTGTKTVTGKHVVVVSVVDIDEDNNVVHLMNESGEETYEAALPESPLREHLLTAFASTEDTVEVMAVRIDGDYDCPTTIAIVDMK